MQNIAHYATPSILLAAILLAGCAPAEDTAPADTGDGSGGGADAVGDVVDDVAGSAGDTVPMAGTAWLTVGTDGAVQTTLIDAEGRYRDIRNGELFGEGGWQQRPDGRVCFEPDTGVGACWETETTDEDGVVVAINGDDRRIELKRVTYTAPEETDEDSAS